MCKLLITDYCKHIHKWKPIGSYKLNCSRRLVLWTMSGLLYVVALIILLLQSQGDATTSKYDRAGGWADCLVVRYIHK